MCDKYVLFGFFFLHFKTKPLLYMIYDQTF